MYKCKYHTKATLIHRLGYTTIRPNEKFAIVKKTDKVLIGYIKRKGRAVKVTVKSDLISNFEMLWVKRYQKRCIAMFMNFM